jgi:hypothetical protein
LLDKNFAEFFANRGALLRVQSGLQISRLDITEFYQQRTESDGQAVLMEDLAGLLFGSESEVPHNRQEAAIRQFFLDAAGAAGLRRRDGLGPKEQGSDVIPIAD